jgi:hypothetical protein
MNFKIKIESSSIAQSRSNGKNFQGSMKNVVAIISKKNK